MGRHDRAHNVNHTRRSGTSRRGSGVGSYSSKHKRRKADQYGTYNAGRLISGTGILIGAQREEHFRNA